MWPSISLLVNGTPSALWNPSLSSWNVKMVRMSRWGGGDPEIVFGLVYDALDRRLGEIIL